MWIPKSAARIRGRRLFEVWCLLEKIRYLFSIGKFGFQAKRKILLTSKYFNQRLLNYKQQFSSDFDYILLAHLVIQK